MKTCNGQHFPLGDGSRESFLEEVALIADIDEFALTSTDGKTFTQNGSLTVQYAGSYTPVLTCKIGNNICAVSEAEQEKLAFSIHSVAPSVSITGVAPTGSISYDNTSDTSTADSYDFERRSSGWLPDYRYYWITNSNHKQITVPSFTNTTATVYFACSHTNDAKYGYGSWVNYKDYLGAASAKKHHEYTQPTVTITLANMGNAETVTLSFGDGTHVYATKGGTASAPYSWTADGGKTMYIGLYGDSDGDDDTKTVAGTITATTLELVHNGITYTIDIADITINNPY